MTGGVEALCDVALRIEEIIYFLIALHVVARKKAGGAVGVIAGHRASGAYLRQQCIADVVEEGLLIIRPRLPGAQPIATVTGGEQCCAVMRIFSELTAEIL